MTHTPYAGSPDAHAPSRPEPAAPAGSRAERTSQIVDCLLSCTDAREEARLRDELVIVNLSVATSIASRYRLRGIATEDLDQVACLALTKAARRFDPRAGHAFLPFCVPTIRGEIRRYFRDHGWMIRPPRRIQELQQRISAAENQLVARLGRLPSAVEVAAELGECIDDVLEATDNRGCFTPLSLDRPTENEDLGSTVGDLIGGDDPGQASIEARTMLAPAVRRLSERDRRILRLRFFDGLTQREIAEEIGVTQMQVSRLLSRIFRDLRDGLGPLEEPGRRRPQRC